MCNIRSSFSCFARRNRFECCLANSNCARASDLACFLANVAFSCLVWAQLVLELVEGIVNWVYVCFASFRLGKSWKWKKENWIRIWFDLFVFVWLLDFSFGAWFFFFFTVCLVAVNFLASLGSLFGIRLCLDKELWGGKSVWNILCDEVLFLMLNLYRSFESSIGYLLGTFPPRSNWRIWNNKFRGGVFDIPACFSSLPPRHLLYWYSIENGVRRRSLNTIFWCNFGHLV